MSATRLVLSIWSVGTVWFVVWAAYRIAQETR